MPQQSDLPLKNKRILITRPAEQAAQLGVLIQQAGGKALLFPSIEISDPPNPQALNTLIRQLPDADLAIFVSPTAVSRAFRFITHWPVALRAAAMGAGSAQALRRAGVQTILMPAHGSDSEALLALPEMQNISGQRMVIFRGEGGRELLADTLRQRGARVEYAECYRRIKPQTDAMPLLQQPIDAVVVTSREGLQNLYEMLGAGWQVFQDIVFFVPHERIAEAAKRLGVHQVSITHGGDTGCVDAMSQRFMVKSGT